MYGIMNTYTDMRTGGDMQENSEMVALNTEDTTLLLSGKDLKDWEVVQKVLARLRKGQCTTTLDACKEAGVPRRSYYAALNNPVVQRMQLQQMMGVSAGTQHLIEKNWLPLVANMISIARGDSREAVPAARFLKEVYDGIGKALNVDTREQDAISDASRAIRSFLGGKRVKLTQVVTTQEIEVQDDVSAGNEIEAEITILQPEAQDTL